jgi:hypothetical protein
MNAAASIPEEAGSWNFSVIFKEIRIEAVGLGKF